MGEVIEMTDLLGRLKPDDRRGSKPRCHFLTRGDRAKVARRLTYLCMGPGPQVLVKPSDSWMPVGFDLVEEPQLDKADLISSASDRQALARWWLADQRPTSRTPTWDIASTCAIDGQEGLLLVEAKAHRSELTDEGKRLKRDSNDAHHERIGLAILESNSGLRLATGLDWHLSRDRSYQVSNRFAWAWKLCTLGRPVALVHLGFVGAAEMQPDFFCDEDDWISLLLRDTSSVVPAEAWTSNLTVDGVTLMPRIRSLWQPLGYGQSK